MQKRVEDGTFIKRKDVNGLGYLLPVSRPGSLSQTLVANVGSQCEGPSSVRSVLAFALFLILSMAWSWWKRRETNSSLTSQCTFKWAEKV